MAGPYLRLLTAPVRLAEAGVQTAVTAAGSAVTLAGTAALVGGSTLTRVGGQALEAVPGGRTLHRTVAGMVVEAVGGPPARRVSRRGSRCWIEVRGLGGPDADALAEEVLAAVREVPGVLDAVINRSVARVVVTIAPQGCRQDLAAVVAEAERRVGTHPRHRPLNLPGDDAALAARALAVAAAAMGLGASLAGAAVKAPGLPTLVSVIPTLADQIPAVRHQIVRRLGHDGTDLLLSAANALSAALTVSPISAAAELANRTMLADETWNARLAWQRYEPLLSQHRPEPGLPPRSNLAFADGAGEQYANRAGYAGLVAATLIGILSGDSTVAGAAALVAAPKPTRATREAFGCAMTRGLINHHDALVMRPRTLRALDRVDVIVVDPRMLYTDELTVSRVRGVENAARRHAWAAAVQAVQAKTLEPGWHALSSVRGAGEVGDVLVSPVRAPLATAVVTAARRTGARVVSVADDGLLSLGQGFDTLYPVEGSLDDTLAALVSQFTLDGATVALLATTEMAAQHEADITIGMAHGDNPPLSADVVVPDLASVWRILRAIPAARSASTRGVRLSMSSTAIGALMLIPGVPGSGPDSVNAGVFAGLWTGMSTGSKVFAEPLPTPEPGQAWFALSAEEVQRLLPRQPSTAGEHAHRPSSLLAGARLAGRAASGAWSLGRDFAAEMRTNLADPITPILATGAVASAVLGSPLDAALVGGVLLTNAALSSQQQLQAGRVLRRLLAVQDPPARRRVGPVEDPTTEDIPARSLNPGDIIEIYAGEVIPADARLIKAVNVEVDESSLTGESLPVSKHTDPTPGAPLAERACMVYAGTTMVTGTALAIVTAVGRSTEVRRAMALAPETTHRIGLQNQLSRITNRALPWSMGGGALVGLLGALSGTPLREAVGSAVGVTVAAVPEGLPLVATLAQLSAARRLTGESVLIRNANAVEALARLDVVCFDKTGTLSENRLQVTGVGPVRGRTAAEVLEAALTTVGSREGRTDHATDDAIRHAVPHTPVAEPRAALPFQSGRPFAAALLANRLTVKGAPEVLCTAIGDAAELSAMLAPMTGKGLRVLAVAERQLTARQAARAASDPAEMEKLCRSGLTAIGLLGMADTLRPKATPLVADLIGRGIGVRLITGDHPVTAAVIAAELGLAVTDAQVMTGTEWETLSVDGRAEAVTSCQVFARMSPEHKVEVVAALERAGRVTAMVGDGANDAAAIRAASVGVAVTTPGSDPARTAADVLLLDGHIEALLEAIDEGEQLWRRVQSAVSVLLGGNLGEVAFALISTLITGRSALNARQMLLVNMLTDALPAAALAVSTQDTASELDRDEAAMWRAIALRGGATTAGATLAWLMGRVTGTRNRAATIALIGLVCTQLTQTLADSHGPLVVTTAAGSFLTLAGIISTPGISQLFGCTPVGPLGWGQALLGTAIASLIGVKAPGMLEGLISILDDEQADPNEDGVNLTDRRGEQPDTHHHNGFGSGDAHDIGHTIRQSPSRD